jgi:hypothetical protein
MRRREFIVALGERSGQARSGLAILSRINALVGVRSAMFESGTNNSG